MKIFNFKNVSKLLWNLKTQNITSLNLILPLNFKQAPYSMAGTSSLWLPFLLKLSWPCVLSSEQSRIAFVQGLLQDKAAGWAVAITINKSPILQSYADFSTEMLRVFDHPLRGKEASGRLFSLRQGPNPISHYAIDIGSP